MRRRSKILMGLAFGAIVMVAAFGLMMNTQVGASLWQFDYEIAEMNINGSPQGTADLPGDEGGGGGGGWGYLRDVRGLFDVRTDYEWWVDVDGQPIYDGYMWKGLLPDVGFQMSAPWRTNAAGEKIEYDVEPVLHREWITGDVKHRSYLYYYAFDTITLTKQDAFTVPGTAQTLFQNWISHEAGVMEVEALVTVQMRKSMFNEVDGEFMDARILDVETTDLQLQSGLNWVLAPSVAVQQDKNVRVPVQNREYGDDYYNCQLQLYCTLTPGLAKEEMGFDMNKYEVWCRKTVQMELMLTDHLQIGEEGEDIDPIDPPIFQRELTLFEMILIILVVIIVIVILIIIFRVIGVAGNLAELGARLKGGG